ncbi:MAG: glycosyltransferase [Elusimicrobiota bacterium]|jgi:undecaprenyl-phosphate 4-deoxy-4-formamido-L-arabinose transferase|nr:glycosyltransferase [Elusimicrobiota bacterium]
MQKVSLVIPVYNEQESLPALFERTLKAMDALNRPYEIIFVNDGSKDKSIDLLRAQHGARPDVVKIIDFNGNFGQHMAIVAGFAKVSGDIVITMDADLQNPPEEIARMLAEFDKGHDVVGTIRENRDDPFYRKFCSKIVNIITNKITGLNIHDYGCMLRLYARRIADIIAASEEGTTFIPAFAQKFAASPAEIFIAHNKRERGVSKYSLLRLISLNFDLMTNFSMAPLQFITISGMAVSALSVLFAVFLFARRLIVGPEAEGLFTLFAIQFFLIGFLISSLGVVGEYVGRVSKEVRKRPKYVIKQEYGLEQRK